MSEPRSSGEHFLIDRHVIGKRGFEALRQNPVWRCQPATVRNDDHYFGARLPRVAAEMVICSKRQGKSGILAKTEHNEVAPAHELAPIYTTTNIATDHNPLSDETRMAASRHGAPPGND